MGVFDFFKSKPDLAKVDTQALYLEAARRGDDRLSKLLMQQSNPISKQNLQTWKSALNAARDYENPNRILLYNLLDSMMLDPHLASIVESRILPVVRSKFAIYDSQTGDEVPELKPLFETSWFENYLRYAMETDFFGTTLIEVMEMTPDGRLKNVRKLPRRHVRPELGIIVKQPGDQDGWNYKEPPYDRYYVQVGDERDLGLLVNLGPVVMAKKFAIGAWQDYVEKYGIPPRWVTSSSLSTTRQEQLATMMQKMVSSSWAVLEGDEKIEALDTKSSTDPYKVFDELIKRLNSEMSKRILGQDGTTDNKDASGTYGSLKVLENVAMDRHLSDKARLKYHINDELIPRLIQMGYPLQGKVFDWDEFNELSPADLIKAVKDLSLDYEIDPEYITEKTGIPILGTKSRAGATPGFGPEAKKKA